MLEPCRTGNRKHDQAYEGSDPAMPDFDQGGKVEPGEPLPVAQRPMVAAPHSGPGDPDDSPEHDQAGD
jgi:hypothetical protein